MVPGASYLLRNTICCLIWLVLAATPGIAAVDADDWAAFLGARGEDEPAATEVIGMSAEELESYAAEQELDVAADEEKPDVFIRSRRRAVIREMKFATDWDCDPTAVPAMVDQFRRLTGMDAQALIPCKPLTFDSPDLFDYPFVYMTAHYAFKFSDAEADGFRRYVERGGFVMADDCLYGQTFGPAFAGEMQKIFPETKLAEIDHKDPVAGMVLKQKFSFQAGEAGIPRVFMNQNPWLGISLGGNLGVLHTVQDIGCYWEISSPPTPSNPLGAGMHGKDTMEPGSRIVAYQLGVNVILFSMLH